MYIYICVYIVRERSGWVSSIEELCWYRGIYLFIYIYIMCVCMYRYVCMYICVWIEKDLDELVLLKSFVDTEVYICLYIYVCIYVYMCARMHVCMCGFIYICVYVHIDRERFRWISSLEKLRWYGGIYVYICVCLYMYVYVLCM
jgi:hypothetical protein